MPEVLNLSTHGFWLLLDGEELFLPFDQFPWFRDASIRVLSIIQRPSPQRLRWPDLDVDLAVDSIRSPENFPLISRVRS